MHTGLDLPRLAASILICQAAGLAGAVFTTPAIPTWYASLEKPFFTPPGWLFAPAWTALYLLMGASLYLVWSRGRGNEPALLVFSAQLGLNALWSLLFFGLRSPLLGLAGILALWAAIALNAGFFWRADRRAGLLLAPYLAWVTFAAALNYWVWALNP
jgi:benzodiazapine receptor